MSFDRYDQEFSSLLEQIQATFNNPSDSKYTENLLQQCDDLIKQMALEARSVSDPDQKRELMAKVRTCRDKYQNAKSESEKQGLFGASNAAAGAGGSSKERLLLQQNEDRLASQNDHLERAHQTMMETEQTAMEISSELGQHRSKLMSAHGRIREMGGLTGRARSILTSMNQRAVQQKMILYGVAGGLVLVFLLLLWSFWR